MGDWVGGCKASASGSAPRPRALTAQTTDSVADTSATCGSEELDWARDKKDKFSSAPPRPTFNRSDALIAAFFMTGAARLQVEVRLSSFDHPKSDLEDVILRHPFTSSLELLFPVRRDCVLEKAYTRGDMRYLALEELLLSAELRLPLHRRRHQTVTVTSQNCSTDTGGALTGGRLEEVYFYSAELSLAQFAQPEFVSAYIASAASGAAADLASAGAGGQRGGFYALSTDSQRLEGADAAAVTPDGTARGRELKDAGCLSLRVPVTAPVLICPPLNSGRHPPPLAHAGFVPAPGARALRTRKRLCCAPRNEMEAPMRELPPPLSHFTDSVCVFANTPSAGRHGHARAGRKVSRRALARLEEFPAGKAPL